MRADPTLTTSQQNELYMTPDCAANPHMTQNRCKSDENTPDSKKMNFQDIHRERTEYMMILRAVKRSSLAFLTWIVLFSASHAEPYPGFTFVNHNGVDPTITEGEINFKIQDRECSRNGYGDGRDENDCTGGNVTSYLIKAYHAKPGDTYNYHLEVKVAPGLEYSGYRNPNGKDSRLRMFAFLRDTPKNHIYEMKLDSRKGATFMGSVCFSPEQFGEWNELDLRIHWTSDATGTVKLTCNGKVVYSQKNVVTTLSPQCIITNHCVPSEQRLNEKIHFVFGLRMDGFGHEWKKYGQKSQFTDIQAGGISASYRNVRVKKVRN